MSAFSRKLNTKQRAYLRELGLSPHAVQLYESLLANTRLTANAAAGQHGRFAAAQYRLFYQLEKYGLARRINGRPVVFEAVEPDMALPAALTIKKDRLAQLLAKGSSKSGNGQDVHARLIIGRQAIYKLYPRLAGVAKQSICTYTIGIAYSPALVEAQREALNRGVHVRHIVQQLKPSNYHVLHAWRRLGAQLRLSPQERGFHLMLFDDTTAVITFSDANNTEDRVSMVTENEAVIALFGKQFEALWQNARAIDI